MGRGKHCTVEERRVALTLRNKGKSLRFIAETLNRSLYFVQNALKKQPSVEHRGRPKKTSLTTDNRIITMAKRDPSFLPEPFLPRLVTLFHPERYAEDYIVPIYLEE